MTLNKLQLIRKEKDGVNHMFEEFYLRVINK